MTRRTQLVLGAIVFAAGLFALTQLTGRADGDIKPVISAAAAKTLIDDEIKVVNDALKDGRDAKGPLPKDMKRARTAALDIALTAMATKDDALLAQTVQVLEAVRALEGIDKDKPEDFDAAKKAA